jgi:hypothetical protein
MSRTTRRRLPGYHPGERHYENAKAKHAPGVTAPRRARHLSDANDFNKEHWFHGRDSYGAQMPVCAPHRKTPRGYCSHDEVWGYGKRWAKKLTGRYRRINGEHDVTSRLNDLD